MKNTNTTARDASAIFCAAIPAAGLTEGRVTAALGLSAGSEVYVGQGKQTGLFPYLSYDTDKVSVSIGGVQYHVVQDDAFQLSFGLSPRFAPDFPDTELFAGLDRDSTVEATVSGTYRFDGTLRSSLLLRRDMLSGHEGYEIEFVVGRTAKLGPAIVEMSLGARHRDKNLNAYIAGVAQSEANSGSVTYNPGATTSPFAGVLAALPINAKVSVIGTATYEYFGSTYSDSPLIDNGYATSASIGVAYTF